MAPPPPPARPAPRAAAPARGGPPDPGQGLQISTTEAYRELAGAERAAVLLLALGEEHGREIWKRLDELEIRQISHAMTKLGPVNPEMLENLFVDFVTRISSRGSLTGNLDSTERILLSFLPPERVNQILEEIGEALEEAD